MLSGQLVVKLASTFTDFSSFFTITTGRHESPFISECTDLYYPADDDYYSSHAVGNQNKANFPKTFSAAAEADSSHFMTFFLLFA